MSIDIKVTTDLEPLKDLMKGFSGHKVVKVGVLTGDSPRDGVFNNADLGAMHEFGGTIQHPGGTAYDSSGFVSNAKATPDMKRTKAHDITIPPRSFLRMPLETKKNELMAAMKTKVAKDAIENGNLDLALELLGIAAEGIVQDAFSTGGFGQWAELSPSTRRKKGSNAPLIDTGQLRRSITSKVENG